MGSGGVLGSRSPGDGYSAYQSSLRAFVARQLFPIICVCRSRIFHPTCSLAILDMQCTVDCP
jgi:hypothetical protein